MNRPYCRDMPPDIRPMCFGALDFLSCCLIDDALESRHGFAPHPEALALAEQRIQDEWWRG